MKKQCTIDAILQFCTMEMWKTAAPPMENRYSRSDGKAAGFPTARKHRFPQLRKHGRLRIFPQRLLLRISFLSCPVLIEREKRTKKEAGASPSAQTEGGAPALLWKSVQNCCFAPLKPEGQAHMGNHKGGSRKSRHRRFYSPFPTLIPTLFRACGLVMRAGDKNCPEALLAGMDTALADLVVLAAAVLPQEESPFQPPLLAPAHRSCSGGFFWWALSGGLRSLHSFFASASRSRMEGRFSGEVRRASPFAASSSSPLRPLFSTPSIIP